jgi:hypothetical protein
MNDTDVLEKLQELKMVQFTPLGVYEDWYAVFIQSSNIFEIGLPSYEYVCWFISA